MYITGTLKNFEQRLHQLSASTGDLALFHQEDNEYLFTTGQEQHINREYQRKYFNYTRSAASLTGWYLGDETLVLDLQFAADQSFIARRGPLPTFTRASAATRVNSAGIIVLAAINEPRIDYNPATLACRGLLLEEQRTNLSIHSENATVANWGKSNISVNADQGISPDGTVNADLISETTASGFHTIKTPGVTTTSGTAYALSLWIKKGTGATAPDWILLGLSSQFPSSIVAFNLTTGAFGGVVGASFTYSAVAYVGGWWRIVLVSTAVLSTTTNPLTLYFTNNANVTSAPSYAGQTTSNIFVWGMQVEAGAFATSYIPTTSASVVRSADVCSITGSAFTSFWNASEGTIALKLQKGYAIPASISQLNYLSVNDGTANNYIQMCQRGSGTAGEVFRMENGGTSQALLQASASVVAANTALGLAGVYKANDVRASCNGGSVVSDTTATVPTLNALQFVTVTSALWIASLQYYKVAKTNAQLQALSTL